jgi:hypothetical protein
VAHQGAKARTSGSVSLASSAWLSTLWNPLGLTWIIRAATIKSGRNSSFHRQTKHILIRDERDARALSDNAQDLRARFSKIHKRYYRTTGFPPKRLSTNENARRQNRPPVHKIVCKVLIVRVEFRSCVYFFRCRVAALYFKRRAVQKCPLNLYLWSSSSYAR